MSASKPHLLLVITEDWYFWSHRLDLALAAQSAGYDVSVATRVQQHGKRIEAKGIRLLPISLIRRGRHPLRELAAIAELTQLYEREKPDIVHHVAMKPILYGTIAARLARIPALVNAFAGLGYAFVEGRQGSAATRVLLHSVLRRILSSSKGLTIFQNAEDRDTLTRARVVPATQCRILRGSGVNLDVFTPRGEPEETPIVLLGGRMLWDKGVGEFVEAAHIVRAKGFNARFVLVGQSDPENPANIPTHQLQRWSESGVIEWWGLRADMPSVLCKASVVVLPSYREGLPKILLEAGACSRPVVATDVPGCREVVVQNVNGLLVPPRDGKALALAIINLVQDRALRISMGARGREIVAKEFSSEKIAQQTLDVYQELLSPELRQQNG